MNIAEKLVQGNRRALAKAITLVESQLDSHQEQAHKLLEQILSKTGKSIRLGITGVPGVGKSTFTESLGMYLIQQGHKVAVLAVDPSSPVTGGSILGDKTRMEELSSHKNAFIRPSPSSGSLGGVAQKTRESMLLCEAAGFDVIIVETVGVGQSETEVAGMVDFFLVLMLPNAGDELQGIKKGVLEIADAIVINKADGPTKKLADRAKKEYQNALHMLKPVLDFWYPPVMTCSAVESVNIDGVWQTVLDFQTKSLAANHWTPQRTSQYSAWMWKLIEEQLKIRFKQHPAIASTLEETESMITSGEVTPFYAASKMLKAFFNES